MKMRWKAAAITLALVAVVAGCTQDPTEPNTRPAAPRFDFEMWDGLPFDTINGDGGYYGSGHHRPPPVDPMDTLQIQ